MLLDVFFPSSFSAGLILAGMGMLQCPAGDRHPCPALPCTKPLFTKCLLGTMGVLLSPHHAVLQGWGQSGP